MNKNTTEDKQGNTIKLRNDINCKTRGVIYGMWCDKCDKIIYVGETKNSVRDRFYQHRHDFTINKKDTPAAHFRIEGHDGWTNLKIIGLERVSTRNIGYRLVRERYWMRKMGTINEENRKR